MRPFVLLCCAIGLVAAGLAAGKTALMLCGLLCAGIGAVTCD